MTPALSRIQRARMRLAQARPAGDALRDLTPAQVAELAVLQALDHLIAVAVLAVAVGPADIVSSMPGRLRLALLKDIQTQLAADALNDRHAGVDELWHRLNPEERTLD